MTDTFDRLKTALTDRYTIVEEVGASHVRDRTRTGGDKVRLLPLIGLILVGCGILNPGDGIRFEWKTVLWVQQEEFVLIEPSRDSAVIRGGMVLNSACSGIDLDHEHLANALTLRVISSTKLPKGDLGCPGVVVMALYTIILSDPVWGDSVIVFHDKRLALRAVL